MTLVTREQVLKLLQQGRTIDEIKSITKASKGAVKIHIRRLKDTGRWTDPQPAFPEDRPAETGEQRQEHCSATSLGQQTGQQTTGPTPGQQTPDQATLPGKPLIFSCTKDIIDFLVSQLLAARDVSDTRTLIEQKDREIGRLRDQVETLQAELMRIKAGIAALK